MAWLCRFSAAEDNAPRSRRHTAQVEDPDFPGSPNLFQNRWDDSGDPAIGV